MGQELHANRFGELEKCCAIAVYSLPTWQDFVSSYTNIRSQLAIFLRDTVHLSRVTHVQLSLAWWSPSWYPPHRVYLFMILDMNLSHNDLLTVLLELYSDLSTYPKSLAQLGEPSLPSLSQAWLDHLGRHPLPMGLKFPRGFSRQ